MVFLNNIHDGLGPRYLFTLGIGIILGFGLTYTTLSARVNLSPPELVNIPQQIGSHLNRDDVSEQKEYWSSYDKELAAVNKLAEEVKVLCWILTNPKNHKKKAIHVKRTWGARCNKLVFTSTAEDTDLPTEVLKDVTEGRKFLWGKTKAAFKLVYDKYLDEADWFMKADDDTYVIVENLRLLLKEHNPDHPIYFGCKFKGFMSGGAGYILSKAALKKFVEVGLPNNTKCKPGLAGPEDVEIGRCLQKIGVEAGDSRDNLGKGRFFPFVPEYHVIAGHPKMYAWYKRFIFYPQKEGLEGCSDSAISFHYTTPKQMYVLDYLIYNLRPGRVMQFPRNTLPPITFSNTSTTAIQQN